MSVAAGPRRPVLPVRRRAGGLRRGPQARRRSRGRAVKFGSRIFPGRWRCLPLPRARRASGRPRPAAARGGEDGSAQTQRPGRAGKGRGARARREGRGARLGGAGSGARPPCSPGGASGSAPPCRPAWAVGTAPREPGAPGCAGVGSPDPAGQGDGRLRRPGRRGLAGPRRREGGAGWRGSGVAARDPAPRPAAARPPGAGVRSRLTAAPGLRARGALGTCTRPSGPGPGSRRGGGVQPGPRAPGPAPIGPGFPGGAPRAEAGLWADAWAALAGGPSAEWERPASADPAALSAWTLTGPQVARPNSPQPLPRGGGGRASSPPPGAVCLSVCLWAVWEPCLGAWQS